MTIIEDGFAEMIGEYGEEMEHAKAKSTTDEGDDFWEKEDGWESDTTTFKALVNQGPSDEEVQDAGIKENIESMVHTEYEDLNTGDLITYGDRDYTVVTTKNPRIGGSTSIYVAGVRLNK